MKVRIKLLSDLCTYSGETYNSIVDADVTHDENGIPYIPARRLKGCIREAALELKEFGLIKQEEYDEIFGKEGNQSTAFSLSNAYILDYDKVVKDLKGCRYKKLKSVENVLKQYTYIRKQTAIDLETGVADKNSLRAIRVIRKNLVFAADCSWNRTVSRAEILGQAVSIVKHMGLSRTRGLGLVEMSISEEQKDEARHVFIDKKELTEQNQIRYTIKLKSPMICKSPQGNQMKTEDYISGSKVLGLIAGALRGSSYQELMSGEEVVVSNGYIMNQGKRCLPAGISLQKEKDQPYKSDGSMVLKDMILAVPEEVRDKQMTPANIHYMDEEGNVADVITEISYHHQRPGDKSIGRATGDDGSSFYQLAAISAGQSFGGYIRAGKREAEQILDAVSELKEVRMGYGKSSEYGAVEFKLDAVYPINSVSEVKNDAAVTLVSDMILYNEKGMLTTDIRVLEKELGRIAGVEDLAISHPFLQFETIGGYNVTWQRRKPVFYAFGKGSTFLIHSDTGFDLGILNGKFIGERVAEGYGEIMVKALKNSADVCIRKEKESVKVADVNPADSEIIRKLLQAEFERRMKKAVREQLERNKSTYSGRQKGLNAAVSKLRMILKNEVCYADMRKQVEGIENEAKNNLCRMLVDVIQPEKLAENVTKEIREEYTSEFENPLSGEKLFKMVYHSYLEELKYFVKSIEKRGE